MWIGGINGIFLNENQAEKYPQIVKLGARFSDFQNSPYRGEFNQKLTLTMGELRDVLIEVARLIEYKEKHND